MIIDILQEICSLCPIKTQIMITQFNCHTNSHIYIYKIHKMKDKYQKYRGGWPFNFNNIYKCMTQKTIEQNKFSKLRSLYLGENSQIKNINHLKDTLTELYCLNCTSLSNIGVCDLYKLRILHCKNIFNLAKLSESLEELHMEKLTQEDINKLKNLVCLSYHERCIPRSPNRMNYIGNYNPSPIKCLLHLKKTLRKLNCSHSSIDQSIIDQLENLDTLICNGTSIYDVNKFAYTLRKLNCSNSGIHQNGISKLRCLEKLECYEQNIYNIDHLSPTLTHISHSFIDQTFIKNMDRLKHISAADHNISNLEHLQEILTHLDIHTKYISCDIIKNMANIVSFGGNISNIYLCPFTKSLKHLRSTWEISQREMELYSALRSLVLENGTNVTNLNHLSKTLNTIICYRSHMTMSGLNQLCNIKYICLYNCKNTINIHNMPKINKKMSTHDSICGIEYHR